MLGYCVHSFVLFMFIIATMLLSWPGQEISTSMRLLTGYIRDIHIICPFLTLWIDVLCQFESVRVGQVSVSRSDGQDQAALSGDELHNHVLDLLLDVHRLVSDRHLRDPRQVDESQVQHCTVRGMKSKKN